MRRKNMDLLNGNVISRAREEVAQRVLSVAIPLSGALIEIVILDKIHRGVQKSRHIILVSSPSNIPLSSGCGIFSISRNIMVTSLFQSPRSCHLMPIKHRVVIAQYLVKVIHTCR